MRLAVLHLGLALALLPAVRAADKDLLDDAKSRLKAEAQRVEKEFTEGRAVAYRLVRADGSKLLEAIDKQRGLLEMVRKDTALETKRREQLIVTLKYDIDNVKELAARKEKLGARRDDALRARGTRDTIGKADDTRRTETGRRTSDDARSIYDARSRSVADAKDYRGRREDGHNKVMRSVDESAMPESGDIRFPKNWKELSMKRSSAVKLTAKEKAIMKALSTVVDVDFDKVTFEEAIDYFRKKLGVEIIVDRRGLEEASVTYEGSQVTLKARATARVVLKRMLADLNLAYVIKDEAIQITSRERASQMTTVRTYYIGDLASVVDIRLPPVLTQLLMIQNVNNLINQITSSVDPQSWKVNNPDAVGSITFDPGTMALVVKQTAENHFLMGGYR